MSKAIAEKRINVIPSAAIRTAIRCDPGSTSDPPTLLKLEIQSLWLVIPHRIKFMGTGCASYVACVVGIFSRLLRLYH